MWALYRVNFYEEVDGPRFFLVCELIERLHVEPFSLWRARELGGEEWYGWGLVASRLTDVLDSLQFQTAATAVNKKAKLRHPAERPEPRQKGHTYRPKSVGDMDLSGFFGGLLT